MNVRTLFLSGLFLFANNPSMAQLNGNGFKVAIVDTGIIRDDSNTLSKVVDQLCWSRADELTDDSYQAQLPDNTILSPANTLHWFDYNIASTCKNGATQDFTRADAAEVPRKTWHWDQDYDWNYFGSSHGTNVASLASVLANGVKLIVVNNSYYNGANDATPDYPVGTKCGFHGPDENVPDDEKPSRVRDCYSILGAINEPVVLNKILTNGNVAAINYSAGSITRNCNDNSSLFRSVVDQGTAIVAAAGNTGANTRVSHPACNQHVIAVGALSLAGSIQGFTNQIGNIDFFALDFTTDYYTTNPLSGTSYASPVVAGVFAVLRQALTQAGIPTSNNTVNQIKYALSSTAISLNKTVVHTNPSTGISKDVPIIDFQVTQAAAQCIINGSCVIDADGLFDVIDYYDGGQYGPNYGDVTSQNHTFEIDFNSIGSGTSSSIATSKTAQTTDEGVSNSAAVSTTISSRRDVILKFTGSFAGAGNKGFRIRVNNTAFAPIIDLYYSGDEIETTFIIPRGYFNNGSNTITIEPNFSFYSWGLKNISAEFTPVIPLTLGVKDTTEYGFDHDPTRYTGIRASFDLPAITNDVLLSLVGYDIDVGADETSVFINGTLLGNLTQGAGSSEYSPQDRFLLTTDLLRQGSNQIELVQRETASDWQGYQDEKWAVKDFLVQLVKPDLLVSSIKIQDKKLIENTPFTATATVQNSGAGSSSTSTLRFYVSTDKTITTADTQIATLSVGSLAPSSNINLSQVMQSPLVNQGYYFGVCVGVVIGEVSASNNCSKAIPFQSTISVASIIMLLLDD